MMIDPKELEEKLVSMKKTITDKDQKIRSWLQEILSASKSAKDFDDAYELITGYSTYIQSYIKLKIISQKKDEKNLLALSKIATKNLKELAEIIKLNRKKFIDEDISEQYLDEVNRIIEQKEHKASIAIKEVLKI